MERGSDKHNPRVDDQLKDAAEPLERGEPAGSHVEEFREQEAVDDLDDETPAAPPRRRDAAEGAVEEERGGAER